MDAPTLLFLSILLAATAATGYAVSKVALDPRTESLRCRISRFQGSHADVTADVEEGPGANRFPWRQPGGKVLVLRNEGKAPAHNLSAAFASMSRPGVSFEFLHLRFPIAELAPGAEARIPLSSRRRGITVGSFRMTLLWHNPGDPGGKSPKSRTMEFP